MGKRDKEHRKKVAKRNEMIKQQQHRLKKAQEDFRCWIHDNPHQQAP